MLCSTNAFRRTASTEKAVENSGGIALEELARLLKRLLELRVQIRVLPTTYSVDCPVRFFG